MRFVNGVAEAAEKAGHHPDIDIRYNRVRLGLVTHDAGGLTAKDFNLAATADKLAATTPGGVGWFWGPGRKPAGFCRQSALVSRVFAGNPEIQIGGLLLSLAELQEGLPVPPGGCYAPCQRGSACDDSHLEPAGRVRLCRFEIRRTNRIQRSCHGPRESFF